MLRVSSPAALAEEVFSFLGCRPAYTAATPPAFVVLPVPELL
jgi:hypothetical protein